ncbi:MAG: glycosyltransferase [Anaerolineae bacterium]|nr:glycosyltransferase [Anaerolineae bacterium]
MYPLVTVIVPVRNSQQHIQGLLQSLFAQDYPCMEIVLVGNMGDQTWQPICDWIEAGKVTTVEVQRSRNWTGRDSNLKRNAGARHAHGEIFVFTDQKIRHEPDWITRGVALMRGHKVEALAGTMNSTPEEADKFWSRFTDGALVKRNPHFPQGRYLNERNFGKSESLPITANWFMTRSAFHKMGGFPEDFRDSYEDYAGAWKAVRSGITFYCTSELPVYHKHRLEPMQIQREYIRSARGAAQLFLTFSNCPFAQRRAVQVLGVLGVVAGGTATLSSLMIVAEWFYLLLLTQVGGLLLLSAAILNGLKVRHWHGLLFPPITLYFVVLFSLHFVRRVMEGESIITSEKYLQT